MVVIAIGGEEARAVAETLHQRRCRGRRCRTIGAIKVGHAQVQMTPTCAGEDRVSAESERRRQRAVRADPAGG